MKSENNNKHLLTRREFFKKAVSTTLPFIAAMTMSSFSGCEKDPVVSGCNGCSSSCEDSCSGSSTSSACSDCSSTCSNSCKDSAKSSNENNNNSNNDKYTAVDLGLSVLWANHNLGASKPEDYGDYYYWGRVDMEYDEWQDLCNDDSISNICGTKYDIARHLWGGNWRLPTLTEIREIIELCSYKIEPREGINGVTLTGPNGKSIFLPVTEKSSEYAGVYPCGEKTVFNDIPILFFNKTTLKLYGAGIEAPMQIRPVKDGGSGCKDCSAGCSNGCQNGCEYSCKDGCKNECTGDCVSVCAAACSNNCVGGCQTGCYGACKDGCENSCYGSCRYACSGTCYNTCGTSCIAVAGS